MPDIALYPRTVASLKKKKEKRNKYRGHFPYSFGYKNKVFPFENNPKNLDLSYKMVLDSRDCFGRGNPIL